MNVRLVPVLITFVLATGLLFGGYFAWQTYAVSNPIAADMADAQGVADVSLETERNRIIATLRLEEDADLMQVYRRMEEIAAKRGSGRDFVIELVGADSPELENIWNGALFELAEAMENRRYGDVPLLMEELAARHPGLSANAAMDESRVYVTLRLGDDTLRKVLPLSGERLEAWSNGQVR